MRNLVLQAVLCCNNSKQKTAMNEMVMQLIALPVLDCLDFAEGIVCLWSRLRLKKRYKARRVRCKVAPAETAHYAVSQVHVS